MRRTSPAALVALAVVGVVAGMMLDTGLAAAGRPVFVPPVTLAVALVLIGAVLVALAWPVRKAVKARTLNAVDPFYATRVLVLAKASSLAGALIGGFGIGVIVYLLTRSVVATGGSVLLSAASVVGGAALVAGGLIAEHMCALPPGSDSSDESDAEREAERDAGRDAGSAAERRAHRGGPAVARPGLRNDPLGREGRLGRRY